MNLDDNLLYNILLYIDIDSFQHLCMSNTTALQICQSQYLWENRFNINHLPLLIQPKTMKEWITEYKTMSTISKEIDDLLKVAHLARLTQLTIPLTLSGKNIKPLDMLKKVFPEQLDDIKLQTGEDIQLNDHVFYLYKINIDLNNNVITVGSVNLSGKFTISSSFTVTTSELKTILIKMFYYYPYIVIKDDYNSSISIRKTHLKEVIQDNIMGPYFLKQANYLLSLYQ